MAYTNGFLHENIRPIHSETILTLKTLEIHTCLSVRVWNVFGTGIDIIMENGDSVTQFILCQKILGILNVPSLLGIYILCIIWKTSQ